MIKLLNKDSKNNLINDEQLQEFEKNINIQVPRDLKKFIKYYQDSKVKEILFFDDNQELFILNAFFSLADIENLTKEFLENLNRKMIPFAYDPGGWHFCLCMEAHDFGSIYINRWTDHLPEEQFLKIANSFEEFINGLQKEE